jgi:hypothetical protein
MFILGNILADFQGDAWFGMSVLKVCLVLTNEPLERVLQNTLLRDNSFNCMQVTILVEARFAKHCYRLVHLNVLLSFCPSYLSWPSWHHFILSLTVCGEKATCV